MKKSKMIQLLDKIDIQQEEIHRLMIKNDLLTMQITTIKAETTDQLLMQDIIKLDVEIDRNGRRSFAF